MLINQKKLDFYVQYGYNVLFEGERGVGKTAIISETFKKAGLSVKYFSAPTMDPWTELVGVPKTYTREDGSEVLRLIQPEDFVDNKYDVIFIDELNRAPKKVMNALMEVIQFKSINGKSCNIKMIWAAINPYSDSGDYHVEELDPAVRDRFQIQIKFPYKCDVTYFVSQLGAIGSIFCEWWDNQPPDVQKEISPRRLFEAGKFYKIGGDIADMLYHGNIKKLKADLQTIGNVEILKDEYNEKVIKKSKTILKKNYTNTMEEFLLSSKEVFNFFLPYLDADWLANKFVTSSNAFDYLMSNKEDPIASDIVKSIIKVSKLDSDFIIKHEKELVDIIKEVKPYHIHEVMGTFTPDTLPDGYLLPKNKTETQLALHYKFNEKYNSNTFSELKTKVTRIANRKIFDTSNASSVEEWRLFSFIEWHFAFILALLYKYHVETQGGVPQVFKPLYEQLTESTAKSFAWGFDHYESIGKGIIEKIKMLSKYKLNETCDLYARLAIAKPNTSAVTYDF